MTNETFPSVVDWQQFEADPEVWIERARQANRPFMVTMDGCCVALIAPLEDQQVTQQVLSHGLLAEEIQRRLTADPKSRHIEPASTQKEPVSADQKPTADS